MRVISEHRGKLYSRDTATWLTNLALQDIQNLSRAAKEAWGHKADGVLPLVLAGFITNVAFAELVPIEQRLQDIIEDPNPVALVEKLKSFGIESGPVDHETEAKATLETAGFGALLMPWKLLLQWQRKPLAIVSSVHASSFGNPEAYYAPASGTAPTKEACLRKLLHDVWQCKVKPASARFLEDYPLYQKLSELLDKKSPPTGLRLAFGLQLLWETSKSYYFMQTDEDDDDNSNDERPNCRTELLEFAKEYVGSLEAVMDDTTMSGKDQNTLPWHLQRVRDEVKEFTEEGPLNLFVQSPWVAGAQMVDLLHSATGNGLRVFNYCQYVGSLVHSYNVLQKVAGFENIKLLDELLSFCGKSFFTTENGEGPTRKFLYAYSRYCGGHLQFTARRTHTTGSYQLTIHRYRNFSQDVKDLKVEPNDDNFAAAQTSTILDVRQRGYHLDQGDMENIDYFIEKIRPLRPLLGVIPDSAFAQVASHYTNDAEKPSHRLQMLMQGVLMTDFNEGEPTLKLNYFQLYLLFVKAIRQIEQGQRGHRGYPNINEDKVPSFLDRLLRNADSCKSDRHRARFAEDNLSRAVFNALVDVFWDIEADDVCWRSIFEDISSSSEESSEEEQEEAAFSETEE